MQNRSKMQQVWASIHRDKMQELEELAKEKDRSVSETIRFAIYHFLHVESQNQE